MKRYNIKTFILPLLILLFSSCEGNKDMLMYDVDNNNYIYFAAPFKSAETGVAKAREDSLVFSFGFAELGTTEYTFKVPVQIAGIASERDREYKIELLTDETTAILNEEYEPINTTRTLKAGCVNDTIDVKIFTSDALKIQFKRIKLKMLSTEDFAVGANEYSTIILSFSNMLSKPTKWWDAWAQQFGPFCQEKYQKWINIYPIPETGRPFDKNYDDNGSTVYWDNMPTAVITSWYPVTMRKIKEMKKYFDDNTVYIDGNPANGRVLLP